MVKDNIEEIRRRISFACAKVNRLPDSVTIVAVSKSRTIEQIREAVEAGITEIGENKVQEAFSKHATLSTVNCQLSTKWHMVGHLQTNKVKDAVKIFDLVQSVDSLHLAAEIDKQAAKINKVQDILLEIKISPEATKFGLNPGDLEAAIKEISGFKNINIRGLMTIAPVVDNPEKARLYFRHLRELRDRMRDAGYGVRDTLSVLSMGMTDDFEVAIEEGSTMVRLGRVIFD